jgi:hypothetical protein
MAIDVVGSKFAPEAKYGQNGDDSPSSLLPGKKDIKRSTFAKSIIAGDGSVSPNPGDWETRPISAAPIKPSPTMRDPNANPAKVPSNSRPVTQQRALNSSFKRSST